MMQIKRTLAATLGRDCTAVALVLFSVPWSVMTVLLDGAIGLTTVRQLQTVGYLRTSGKVTKSSVGSNRDSEGDSNTPKISYRYSVGGKEYDSDRYETGDVEASYGDARAIVDLYPADKTIDVFYDRADPALAVLRPGIGGRELFMLVFAAPFNLWMAGLWFTIYGESARGKRVRRAGGAKIIDDGMVARVRMLEISPLAVVLAAAGFLTFILTLLIAVVWRGNPPLSVMVVVWIVLLSTGWLVYNRITRPENELVIDDVGRRLTLPKGFGRTEPTAMPLDKVLAVEVMTVDTAKRNGPRYQPTLVFANEDGSLRRERLVVWVDQSRAVALAEWLRDRLRLQVAEKAGRESLVPKN
jgi:hypothetical protein